MKKLIKLIDINLSYWWENILQLAVVLICLLTQKKAIKDLNNQLIINSFDTYQKGKTRDLSVKVFQQRIQQKLHEILVNEYKRT